MKHKVLSLEEVGSVSEQLHTENQRIVIVGGCFDLLHIGHITFLEEAKKKGDKLIVLLESDEQIKKRKGEERPINTQIDRAIILSHLTMIDYVITLAKMETNEDYDRLIKLLKPAIIATTWGDPNRSHKERQAKEVNAKVVDVIMPIKNQSTTRILTIINEL